MNDYNRTEHLKELHNKRRTITQEKVDRAIQCLIKSQKAISFNGVASEGGISKKTLYDNKDIRERIETIRHQQVQVPTPSQVKREMNDNNKDVIIAILKRKIRNLENNLRLITQIFTNNYSFIKIMV